jgi:hypothetical protein
MEQVGMNGWWGDRWTGGVRASGERVLSDLNTRFIRFRFTGHHSPTDKLFRTSTHNIGSPQVVSHQSPFFEVSLLSLVPRHQKSTADRENPNPKRALASEG